MDDVYVCVCGGGLIDGEGEMERERWRESSFQKKGEWVNTGSTYLQKVTRGMWLENTEKTLLL